MNIDILNAHCGPGIPSKGHACLRVVCTIYPDFWVCKSLRLANDRSGRSHSVMGRCVWLVQVNGDVWRQRQFSYGEEWTGGSPSFTRGIVRHSLYAPSLYVSLPPVPFSTLASSPKGGVTYDRSHALRERHRSLPSPCRPVFWFRLGLKVVDRCLLRYKSANSKAHSLVRDTA